MIDRMFATAVLAQAQKPEQKEEQAQQQEQKPADRGGDAFFGGYGMIVPMVAIAVLWYFMLLRPQKREQAKRQQLLKELKKNDRVVTIGGIFGTIASVTPDGKEVTIKVDDNTRLKMLRSAIQSVLKDETEGEAAKS